MSSSKGPRTKLGYDKTISADDLFLNEPDHHTPRDIGVGGRLDPLGKIIYRYEDEAMTIRGLGLNGPNDIYPPNGERPRGGHDIQRMRRSIDIVCKRLTFVAFPYMDTTITFPHIDICGIIFLVKS